jgi:hypothetical protein
MSTPKPFTLRVSDDDMGICVRASVARILLGRSFGYRVVVFVCQPAKVPVPLAALFQDSGGGLAIGRRIHRGVI